MKILALITIMSVLFVPTISVISAHTPILMVGQFPYKIEEIYNSEQSNQIEDTSAILNKIEYYASILKDFLINLPQELWNQLMEILPDSIQEKINL